MLISVLHLPLIINDHNKAREGREPLFRDLLTPTSGSKFSYQQLQTLMLTKTMLTKI